MSIHECAMLRELTLLVRDVGERVKALEQRSPGWSPWPADIFDRLERLECTAEQRTRGNTAQADPVPELMRRIKALEARRDPASLRSSNAERVAHGKALRAAIADILQSDSGATGPRVIEALRASHAGKLPSLRTVRWHLAAIRAATAMRVRMQGSQLPKPLENHEG